MIIITNVCKRDIYKYSILTILIIGLGKHEILISYVNVLIIYIELMST